jgi:hypothetical protein
MLQSLHSSRIEALATGLAIVAMQVGGKDISPEALMKFIQDGAEWAGLYWFKGESE